MPDYADLASRLTRALALADAPIAVCLSNTVPAGVRRWSGPAPAGCFFWQEAARGAFATDARDHESCAIGTFTHNLDATPAHEADRRDALKVFADLKYVTADDLAMIPVLATRPRAVVYAPLAATPLPPDVVLLLVRANQTLILSEASQSLERGLPPAMGRPACAVVPQAKNTGRAALSLGCCGARAYLDVLTADKALYAIPGPRLEAYTARVEELASANTVLTSFHRVRRADIEAGGRPSVQESLAAMQARGR
ncbi:MAG TPA: DUF169 domain-containing protein [Candidatus Limnocylindria bacterium]|nr:DUF169 domain-containing protein [Candidatus Limnocylindria bacterium]